LIPLSGLALVLFLLVHLGAVALAWLDGTAFEAWSTWLHHRWWLAPLELALAVVFLLHPLLALVRSLTARARRGPAAGPLRSRRGGGLEGMAALAARWIPASGALLGLFLGVHLLQLRWHRPADGAELALLRQVLANPASGALYGLAGLALALHLFHGHEAAHRSLGWLDAANGGRIRWAGRAAALLLGGLFSLVALALALGWGVTP
jgi:succinate dehydrogenase / fumarate reductase cytochrome b subunit